MADEARDSERGEDLAFLLRRAHQEAIAAIASDKPPASAAHFELSRRYSDRAVRQLVGGVERSDA